MNYIEKFYRKYIDLEQSTRTDKDNVLIGCPFHNDKRASLSINLANGLWKCHTKSCKTNKQGNGGGDMAKFATYCRDITIEEARNEVAIFRKDEVEDAGATQAKAKSGPLNITDSEIIQKMESLQNSEKPIAYLKEECLFTDETIHRFELGFDGNRIWIPIRENKQLVNIRKYAAKPKNGSKIMSIPGHGQARLWPFEHMDSDLVYLFEGEKDCMLAIQLGLNAVTVTGGAGTFKLEWAHLFKGKEVYVCYDIDQAGVEGAAKVANSVAGVADSVRIIQLPITEPPNGDFTDYIKQGHTIEEFLELCRHAEPVTHTTEINSSIPDEVYETNLKEASYNKTLIKKRVKLKICIMGKQDAIYNIPHEISVACSMDFGTCCNSCGLGLAGKQITFPLREHDPDLLSLIDCKQDAQTILIKKKLGIMAKCNRFKYLESPQSFIEKVYAIPTMDDEIDEDITRGMYVLGEQLRDNTDYEIEAVTLNHPKTQELIHIVYKAEPSTSSIDEFKITTELYERLKVFQCQ